MRQLSTVALVFLAALVGLNPDIRERVGYTFAPSAEAAFEIGQRHFDSSEPGRYDIDKAEGYLQEAYIQNPSLLYLNHQMARIAFLRGKFHTALWYIDKEIKLQGESFPNAYYMRGLIQGYMGRYEEAAADYGFFLTSHPESWAGLNDYAWVLLKAGRPQEAADATERGLANFPNNAWLLNTSAIAHYESGNIALAQERIDAAAIAVENITEAEWLKAYPGNDPKIARVGIDTLRASTQQNMHTIAIAKGKE